MTVGMPFARPGYTTSSTLLSNATLQSNTLLIPEGSLVRRCASLTPVGERERRRFQAQGGQVICSVCIEDFLTKFAKGHWRRSGDEFWNAVSRRQNCKARARCAQRANKQQANTGAPCSGAFRFAENLRHASLTYAGAKVKRERPLPAAGRGRRFVNSSRPGS